MEERAGGHDRSPGAPAAGAELERQLTVARQLRATTELAARLASTHDPDEVCAIAVQALVESFGAALAEVWRADGPGRLRRAAQAGAAVAGRTGPESVDVGSEASLVADVARTHLPVVIGELVGPLAPVLEEGPPITAAAVLPVLGGAGAGEPRGARLHGVIAAWFHRPVPVEVADVIALFTSVVSGALHAAQLLGGEERGGGVQEGHRQVVESEQRFRSFVDNLRAVVWEADATTLRFSFVSQGAAELLGYPAERWTSEPGFWPGIIHPDDRDYAVAHQHVAAGEGRDHELEYRIVAADGRVIWVRDMVRVELGPDGRARRLLGVMVDVTHQKRVEQALLESRARFASLARTLQASLLPPHLPDIFGLEVAARYRPAEEGVEVVGDFYDLFDVGGDGWGVVIGDVCGKGPEAAALTALARYTVRAAAIRERRPSRVLALLNQAVLRDDSSERFCTATYARVVPHATGVSVELSCGGHPLPLTLRADGRVERVGRAGTLLGMFEAVDLADTTVELGPGDALVLYTDGAIEARQGGEVLGEERLMALVAACAHLRCEEIASRLEDGILTFQDGASQDDLALVVLKVPG